MDYVMIPAHKDTILNSGYANLVQKKHHFALSAKIQFAQSAHKITFLNLIIACLARTNLRTVRIVIFFDAFYVRKIITLTIRVKFA